MGFAAGIVSGYFSLSTEWLQTSNKKTQMPSGGPLVPPVGRRLIMFCAVISTSLPLSHVSRSTGEYGGMAIRNLDWVWPSALLAMFWSLVCRAAICTTYATPLSDNEIRSSHAGIKGSVGTRRGVPSPTVWTLPVLLDGCTWRGGWDEHRPPSFIVAVMKTISRSYPAHSRPLSMHFRQWGRSLSH